jgi:hypothetical protein
VARPQPILPRSIKQVDGGLSRAAPTVIVDVANVMECSCSLDDVLDEALVVREQSVGAATLGCGMEDWPTQLALPAVQP